MRARHRHPRTSTLALTLLTRPLGHCPYDIHCAWVTACVPYVQIGFSTSNITVEANNGASGSFLFNKDDLLVEEESRHNMGNKEPWCFKERVSGSPGTEVVGGQGGRGWGRGWGQG